VTNTGTAANGAVTVIDNLGSLISLVFEIVCSGGSLFVSSPIAGCAFTPIAAGGSATGAVQLLNVPGGTIFTNTANFSIAGTPVATAVANLAYALEETV
jgi:hypothetical protein